MPKVEMTEATISHIWDDDSKTDYRITKGESSESGPYIMIDSEIIIYPDSWPEIRDQIQKFIDSISINEF